MPKKPVGWRGEPRRHSLAARGIKTVPYGTMLHREVQFVSKTRHTPRETTFSWYKKSLEDGKETWEGEIRSNGKFVGEVKIVALREGKMEKGRGILIEEIYIVWERQFSGFGTDAVNELKKHFDRIQAFPQPRARGFWKKMKFKETDGRNWEWKND